MGHRNFRASDAGSAQSGFKTGGFPIAREARYLEIRVAACPGPGLGRAVDIMGLHGKGTATVTLVQPMTPGAEATVPEEMPT